MWDACFARLDQSLPALREVLEQRGVLDQLKARIRAEVFGALDEQVQIYPRCVSIFRMRLFSSGSHACFYGFTVSLRGVCCDRQNEPKPQPSNINLVLNELIREYMEFNRYRHSLAVFIPGLLVNPSKMHAGSLFLPTFYFYCSISSRI
jgi:hypothetical protein